MRSLMPWTGMGNVKQEIDRLFDRFVDAKWDDFPAIGEWAPSMDISETKRASHAFPLSYPLSNGRRVSNRRARSRDGPGTGVGLSPAVLGRAIQL